MFCKAVPTRDVTNPVSFPSFCYMEDIPVLLYSVILFNYSHDQSNESSSSSSTTFQKFPGIYDLVFVSVFGKRLSGKSNKVVVFPLAFHTAVQQPFKPLWSRLLLYNHEPFRA